jgi:L-ribulokinase
MINKYVIGVDYGTDSVRAIIVDAISGNEIASAESHFIRWNDGLYCNPTFNQFRQHPSDYIEGLEAVIKQCLIDAGDQVKKQICSISIATTGSTPVAVDGQGTPLALLDSFRDNTNAMFVLWKDHTSIKEADEINLAAKKHTPDYLKYVGGAYSSEWYWAKLLHILRADEKVRNACYTWVEHSDWMPFLLTGGKAANEIKRNVCAAGHKGLWSPAFGGLPSPEFFESVDSLLTPFVLRFGKHVYSADKSAGTLSKEWAERLGLSTDVIVGIGAIDAHVGAVGGGIKPYFMSKVIGTSTCDMIVVPRPDMRNVFVEGISGQVEDSILPGMVGLEAGQSAFGDIYSWFRDLLLWPLKTFSSEKDESGTLKILTPKFHNAILKELDKQASELPFDQGSEFALDWFNGRRTPDTNPNLKGLIGGLTLGSTPAKIYRALIEATCFGSRAIMERIQEQGIAIKGLNAIGGISSKSEFIMQMMADVLNTPVRVSSAVQAVALGAAMFAAVAGGIHNSVEDAMNAMGKRDERLINPQDRHTQYYDRRYKQYKRYGKMQDD